MNGGVVEAIVKVAIEATTEATTEATIVVEENGFKLVRYKEEPSEPDEDYLSLWHMHPEREKKQGLISDGRRCMDCGIVAPEVFGGYPVDSDGYVASEWHNRMVARQEANQLRKFEDITEEKYDEWVRKRKERRKETT